MALMNCPECEKNISDKAHACPFCGFPLDEYFEKLELEKQNIKEKEQRKIEEEQRKKQRIFNAETSDFLLGEKKFSLNVNQKICAIVGSEFEIKKESIHKKIQKLLFVNEEWADLNDNQFRQNVDILVDILVKPLEDISLYLCNKFIKGETSTNEDKIRDAFEHRALSNDLYQIYKSAKVEYDLNCDNAHSKYYDDYYAAGTPAEPISDVYSRTLVGLVGKNISAKLVNGATAALTSGVVKVKEEQARDRYHAAIMRERIICNAQIYSTLDAWVDTYVNSYKKYVLEYLLERGQLFEKTIYPLEEIDFADYSRTLNNPEVLNCKKKEYFYKLAYSNPGDFFIYVEAIREIVFSKEEFQNILCIIDYFEFREVIKQCLEENNHIASCLLEKEVNVFEKFYRKSTKKARSYENKIFESVEEKENYIQEKTRYERTFDDIFNLKYWFDFNVFSEKYNTIKNMGMPQTEQWQKRYQEVLGKAEEIILELEQEFINQVTPAVRKMMDGKKSVKSYAVLESRNALYEEIEYCNELEGYISEHELLVLRVRWAGMIFYITTRAFYCVETENKSVVARFTLDEIERISYSKNGLTTSQHFDVYLFGKEKIRVFGSYYPEEDIPALNSFAKELIELVKRNPAQIKQKVGQVCQNTPNCQLTYTSYSKQIDMIASSIYMISGIEIYKKDALICKFSFEITSQSDYELEKIIRELKIGNEFIFFFDNYRIITDKAIYITKFYNDFAYSTKYEFAMLNDIVTSRNPWDYRDGFVISLQGKSELVLAGREAASFIKILDSVCTVLRASNLFKSELYQNDFLYCMSCNSLMTVDWNGLKRCPKCSEKLRKSGWIHRSSWERENELKLKKLSDGERENIKQKIIDRTVFLKEYLHESEFKELQRKVMADDSQIKLVKNEYIFCQFCGQKIKRTAKFCNYCGKKNSLQEGK